LDNIACSHVARLSYFAHVSFGLSTRTVAKSGDAFITQLIVCQLSFSLIFMSAGVKLHLLVDVISYIMVLHSFVQYEYLTAS
jgi:hypothetical protein